MQPSSSIFSQYQTFNQNRVKPEDYVKRYNTELGVDDARARVKSSRAAIKATEDTIAGQPDSVAGRTSGSLVTDSQRNRLVQNEIAPLNEVMRTQNNAYGEASSDLNTLSNDADKQVGYALQSDDTQGNSLLQMYQAAVDTEKQAEAKRQWEAQQAEQKRQFDATLKDTQAARKSAAVSSFSPSFGAPAAGAKQPAMVKKSGNGGFAFADANGKSISAATYATQTGQDVRDLLYTMGKQGDGYAAQLYNQLRADPYFGKGNAAYDTRIKNMYSAIFWGA